MVTIFCVTPPFQENYAEASTSSEPTEDTQINLMGLNSEQQIFLTQDDQEAHIFNQFQSKSENHFISERDMMQLSMRFINNIN